MAKLTRLGSTISQMFAARGANVRSVKGAVDLIDAQRGEIQTLRARLALAEQDAARFSWLSLNVTAELHLGGEKGNTHVVRWVRRYITCETFCGTDLRDAVDAAILFGHEKAEGGAGAPR
jgi:hypothetical protein